MAKRKPRKAPRNSLEQRSWDYLKSQKLKPEELYEPYKIPYSIKANYNPDFVLPNGIVVELKGYFRVEDKRKMKSVKECHPHLDIRMIFDKPSTPSAERQLAKSVKWCKKNGFNFAIGCIPKSWL